MVDRLKEAIVAFGWVLGTGSVSWLFSWLLQFVCSLVAGGPGFDISSQPINLLAVCSVVMTGSLVFVIWSLVETNCNLLMWCLSIVWFAVIGGVVQWAVMWVFTGTPVSNPASQVAYGILTFVWGLLNGYVLVPEKPSLQEKE
jgi:hypothetical protein